MIDADGPAPQRLEEILRQCVGFLAHSFASIEGARQREAPLADRELALVVSGFDSD
jgi:hypothetical protein